MTDRRQPVECRAVRVTAHCYRSVLVPAIIVLPLLLGFASSYFRASDRFHTTINLSDLGRFPFDDQSGALHDVPETARRLDNQRVVIEGNVFVNPQKPGFQMVIYRERAWPRQPPLVQERVFVHTRAFQSIPTKVLTLVRVYGTFHVNVKRDSDGFVTSVFELDADRIVAPGDASTPDDWLWGLACSSLLAMLFLARAARNRLISRSRLGRSCCARCGYDLRATPALCPECGTPVAHLLL